MIRAAPTTTRPPGLPSTVSTWPKCTPARISRPSSRTSRCSATAQRTASAGVVNVAKDPSPACVTFLPAEPLQGASDDLVMGGDEHAPSRFPQLRRDLRQSNDVGEQRRRERSMRTASSHRCSRRNTRTSGKGHDLRGCCFGRMAERTKATVLKTVSAIRRARIAPPRSGCLSVHAVGWSDHRSSEAVTEPQAPSWWPYSISAELTASSPVSLDPAPSGMRYAFPEGSALDLLGAASVGPTASHKLPSIAVLSAAQLDGSVPRRLGRR
jgi:hypothetical protein